MSATRKASVSLQFIVIGGSIAGLACAYALQQAGHRVHVLEKNPYPAKGNSRVASPPNMTRILNEWGLGPRLAEVAWKRSANAIRLGATGKKLGKLVFREDIMEALGADFLNLTHGDLYTFMYELALKSGAVIQFGAEVVGIDAEQASVVLSTGDVFSGDVVIGADGLGSLVRRTVFHDEQCASSAAGPLFTAYALVDAEVMAQDEDLRFLLEEPEMTLWVGDGYSIWGCPSKHHKRYSVGFAWPNDEYGFSERHDRCFPVKDLALDRRRMEPRLCKLIQSAETIFPTSWVPRDPLDSLVHGSGKVILVGAAAHSIPPNMELSAAVGIEDAAALGNLFSRIRSREQIPSFTSAFDDLRQPRSVDVQRSERRKLETLTMRREEMKAPCVDSDDIAPALSQALPEWDNTDEEVLREAWERWEYLRMFDYNATEAVDDWWIKWGGLMNSSSADKMDDGNSMQICVSACL